MDKTRKPIKVLALVGAGRSGSTILGKVLGQLPGFTFVGEAASYFEYGIASNKVCGCGRPFRECSFWQAVGARALGGNQTVTREQISHLHHLLGSRDIPSVRQLPLRLLLPQHGAPPNPHYLDTLDGPYRAIAAEAGARVVVDSSKLPTYAYLLGLLPSVELSVLHLVRDPRAVAYSWQRKKEGWQLEPISAAKSTYDWLTRNLFHEVFARQLSARYRRVLYEDFARAPAAIAAEVAAFVGVSDAALPFTGEREIDIAPHHCIGVNYSHRTSAGTIAIRADAEWQQRIAPRDRITATLVALPLLWKYGCAGTPDPKAGAIALSRWLRPAWLWLRGMLPQFRPAAGLQRTAVALRRYVGGL